MSGAVPKIYTAAERLRVVETSSLEQQESIIADGLRTFIEVGRALKTIRDGQLYRTSGFSAFESYCRQRWEMSKTNANRLIAASDLVVELTPIGVTPSSESHVRPLFRLPESERAKAWEKAVTSAPDGKVTAKHVAQVVSGCVEPTQEDPFHLLVESGRLRDAIARLADRWTSDQHKHIPSILREIADEMEAT